MRRLLVTLTAFLLLSTPAHASWSWPVRGDVITPYRNGDDPYAAGQHRGIDIAAPVGTPVMAAAGGEVRFAGTAGLVGPDGERADRRRVRHLIPAPVRDRGPRRRARVRRRAPGRGRHDGTRSAVPAPPALRRTRGGQAARLHRPAVDAAAGRGAPAERGATPGAGTSAAALRVRRRHPNRRPPRAERRGRAPAPRRSPRPAPAPRGAPRPAPAPRSSPAPRSAPAPRLSPAPGPRRSSAPAPRPRAERPRQHRRRSRPPHRSTLTRPESAPDRPGPSPARAPGAAADRAHASPPSSGPDIGWALACAGLLLAAAILGLDRRPRPRAPAAPRRCAAALARSPLRDAAEPTARDLPAARG